MDFDSDNDTEIDYDEYPWLHPDDPWFGRPFIGDEHYKQYMSDPREKLQPMVAIFYSDLDTPESG